MKVDGKFAMAKVSFGHSPVARLQVWVLGLLALLATAGCTNVPTGHVTTDRMDYGQVVAESWKRQTLLNVVRLRYADAPVFLHVSSIINSYTLAETGQTTAAPVVTIPSR